MTIHGSEERAASGGASGAAKADGADRGHLVKAVPHAAFDLDAIATSFPDTAETMLLDERLTDEDAASARVFRIYEPAPAHHHETCNEYLLVLSGRGRFFMGELEPFEVGPGQMLFFKRGTVHGMPEILEHPVVMVSVDTPRRDPSDIVFANPDEGTPAGFIAPRK